MNTYDSILTSTYSERRPAALSKTEAGNRTVSAERLSSLLKEGQILRGEITNRQGSSVTLLLSDGSVINARLYSSVMLSIGQTASFEVQQADALQILLQLLPEDASAAENTLIQKALDAAGLPPTGHNEAAVRALLNCQMSVSRENIHRLLQQSSAFKNADVSTLALLNKYKLPVNQTTVGQAEAYRGFERQILPKLSELANALAELSSSESPLPAAVSQKFIQLLNTSAVPTADTGTAPLPSGIPAQAPQAFPAGEPAALPTAEPAASFSDTVPVPGTSSSDSVTILPATEAADFSAAVKSTAVPSDPESISAPFTSDIPAHTAAPESADFPGSASLLLKSSHTPVENETEAALSFLKRWTLSVPELTEETSVSDFYRRLLSDLDEIREILHEAIQKLPDEEAETLQLLQNTAKNSEQLQDNLQFMNLLNRFFPYVQLPLRFREQTAHGELYVYTKKESLRKNPSEVSVLLHLDMANLGPTDIYLALNQTTLSAKFYLAQEELQPLFAEHLPELKQTLTEKGLSVSYEIITREKEIDPVREFLNTDAPDMLSCYTFDCRA